VYPYSITAQNAYPDNPWWQCSVPCSKFPQLLWLTLPRRSQHSLCEPQPVGHVSGRCSALPLPPRRVQPPLKPQPWPGPHWQGDTAPLHVQMCAVLAEWAAIGAPPWVLREIRVGVPLPWASTSVPYRAAPYPLPPQLLMSAVQEAQRWCSAGFSRRPSRLEATRVPWVSPAFIADRLRKPRLVLDLKYVNGFLHNKPF